MESLISEFFYQWRSEKYDQVKNGLLRQGILVTYEHLTLNTEPHNVEISRETNRSVAVLSRTHSDRDFLSSCTQSTAAIRFLQQQLIVFQMFLNVQLKSNTLMRKCFIGKIQVKLLCCVSVGFNVDPHERAK